MKLIKKIINYFKSKLKLIFILHNLKFGEIVVCDVKKTKVYDFKEGHQIRPYVVIYSHARNIYALPMTSQSAAVGMNTKYKGVNGKLLFYELVKINFKQVVNANNDSLNCEEKQTLIRILFQMFAFKKDLQNKLKNSYQLKAGDIVTLKKDEQRYAIAKVKENTVLLVPIEIKERDSSSAYHEYSFEYEKIISVPQKNVQVVGMLNEFDHQLLKNSLKVRRKIKNEFLPGDFIKILNNYYIVNEVIDDIFVVVIPIVPIEECEIYLEISPSTTLFLAKKTKLIHQRGIALLGNLGKDIIAKYQAYKQSFKKQEINRLKLINTDLGLNLGNVVIDNGKLKVTVEIFDCYVALLDYEGRISFDYKRTNKNTICRYSKKELNNFKNIFDYNKRRKKEVSSTLRGIVQKEQEQKKEVNEHLEYCINQ